MAAFRIAFGRIQQESNALTDVLTTLEDFERVHLKRGEDLLEACSAHNMEAEGFLKNAELSGFVQAMEQQGRGDVDLVPLTSAWAVSGGPLTKDTFETLSNEIIHGIRSAGNIDAIFLAMHGAMSVVGDKDPEGTLLMSIREEFGEELPIAITLDLHANLTTSKVEGTTILTAYRTNPHRDHKKVGFRAGTMLLQTLRQEVAPTSAWRSLPLVLGGGTTLDFLPPMRAIFGWMKKMEQNPKVLYLSLFMAHPWNDHPDMGWAVHVITDNAPELAEELADTLAEKAWGVRTKQPPEFPTIMEAIPMIRRSWLRRKFGCAVVCDASDVVGAGASGENTHLLASLLENGKGLQAYVPLRDAEAVDELWDKDAGEKVTLLVGGKLDPKWNVPLEVTGTVGLRKNTRHFGRAVVLDLGDIKLAITEAAPMVMDPEFFNELGMNLWAADVAVVKSFFPFRLYFWRYNRKSIYVRTRGATDFDAAKDIKLADPVYPFEDVSEWRPVDRRRRSQI